MIKMLRDAFDDEGKVLYTEGEIVCATVEEEDILVRRNFAEWHDIPESELAPVNTDNAAVEGEDA